MDYWWIRMKIADICLYFGQYAEMINNLWQCIWLEDWRTSQFNVKVLAEICWPVILELHSSASVVFVIDDIWTLFDRLWLSVIARPWNYIHVSHCGVETLPLLNWKYQGVLLYRTQATGLSHFTLNVYQEICHTCCAVQHKSQRSDNQTADLLFVYFIDSPPAPQQRFHTCICKTNHETPRPELLKAGGSQSNIIKNVKSQLDLGRHSWALSSKDDVCVLPRVLHYRERGPACKANSSVLFLGTERFERAAALWKLAPLRWRS